MKRTLLAAAIIISTGLWLCINSFDSAQSLDPPQTLQRNVVMNGDMQIWQWGTSYTNEDYSTTADRWVYASDTANLQSVVTRSTDVPDPLYAASWRVDANNVNSGDNSAHVRYGLEGMDLRPIWGKRAVYSFWNKSNKTGTYSIGFSNSNDRTYIGTYTVDAANTWEFEQIELPLDTLSGGTWSMNEAELGLKIRMNFKVSSPGYGTADAWNNGNYTGTSSNVNLWDNADNYYMFTGVQLHEGATAQDFVPEDYTTLLNKCMRYQVVFTTTNMNRTTPSSVTNGSVTRLTLPTKVPLMRGTTPDGNVIPYITITGTRGTDWELRTMADAVNTTGTIDANQTNNELNPFIRVQGGTFTAGTPMHIILLNSSAKIRVNAELY